MTTWTEGYVSEVNYTSGYYRELNPQQLIMPLLMAGIAPPKIKHACELGFGMGVSLAAHAAAGEAMWYGTDFNPSHTLNALALTDSLPEGKVVVANQSFSEFCQRDDLPNFDFIALHGIFSWVSPENQAVIIDFISRKLNVGGVVYVSYNTLPGWSSVAPLQHLIAQGYRAFANPQEGALQRMQRALDYTAKIIEQSPEMIAASPATQTYMQHILEIAKERPNYVSHEYLNQYWKPMYFAEMAEMMGQAKLSYACSSGYLSGNDAISLNDEMRACLAEISDPLLKQSVRDFLLNTRFRRDIWVKGKRELSSPEWKSAWLAQRVVQVGSFAHSLASKGIQFHGELNQVYLDVLSAKLGDHQIYSVAELSEALGEQVDYVLLFTLLSVLLDIGVLALVQRDEVIAEAEASCRAFNQQTLKQLFSPNAIQVLASPVTGGGVAMSEVDLLFLEAHTLGLDEAAWCEHVWARLQFADKAVLNDNQPMTEAAHLLAFQQKFVSEWMPVCRSLKLI